MLLGITKTVYFKLQVLTTILHTTEWCISQQMVKESKTHCCRVQTNGQKDRLDTVSIDDCTAGHQQSCAGDQKVRSRYSSLCHIFLKVITLRHAMMQQTQPTNATTKKEIYWTILYFVVDDPSSLSRILNSPHLNRSGLKVKTTHL